MARASVVESSIPGDPDYDPELGEDMESEIAEEESPPEVDAAALIEAQARSMGWKPAAEYRGPPGRWKDAATFVRDGETELPILRDQNRRMSERLLRIDGEVGELRRSAKEQLDVIKDLRSLAARADQRGYERAMAQLKKQQRDAVVAGDAEAYDQLVEQAEALEEARGEPVAEAAPATAAATPPPPAAAPVMPSEISEFMRANPWFNRDPLLTRYMIVKHQDVMEERPDAPLDEQLAEALDRLQADYPEKFNMAPRPAARPAPAPRRTPPRAASVAPPAPQSAQPRPGTAATINAITDPAERATARDAFNRMKRQLPDFTEAEYMELYADPHADVLEVQAKTRKRANAR